MANQPNPLVRITFSDAYTSEILETFVSDSDYKKIYNYIQDHFESYEDVDEYETIHHVGDESV